MVCSVFASVNISPDVDFKSHLKQNEYIVQNAGDSLNLNCNMELKKRTRSDEMLAFSPRKRAR
jgi:hypothetical protein